MHYQKYGTAGVQGIFRHVERYKNPKTGQYIKFGNENIDPSRTHLNYNLGPDREMTQYQFLKKRLAELTYRKQKNNITVCSWIITAPKNMSVPEEQEKLFKRLYKEFCAIYGEENVISAYVHNDETTPHMHFVFVPATSDGKLSASKTTTKALLKTIHNDFQMAVNAEFQSDTYRLVAEEPEERATGSKPVDEMKKALQSLETKVELDTIESAYLQEKINNQSTMKKSLEGQIEALQNEKTHACEQADMWKVVEQGYKQSVAEEKQKLSKLRETIERERDNFNRWKAAAYGAMKRAATKIQEFMSYADYAEQEFSKRLMQDVTASLGDISDFPEAKTTIKNDTENLEL